MKRALLLFISFAAINVYAIDPQSLTNETRKVIQGVLGMDHLCYESMKWEVKAHGWTPCDCSEILLLAEQLLRGSANENDVFCRGVAVSLLGDFGGTNALPALAELFRKDRDEHIRHTAAGSYIRIARADPKWMQPLKEELVKSPTYAGSFAWNTFHRMAFLLEYCGQDYEFQRNLLRFLLDQATVETGERAMLDEILCREVPKWRASPQRAENAARMKALYADDVGIVSFFSGIERDAVASRTAMTGDGGKDALGNEASAQGNRDAGDQWADLLDNLPEKRPWEPPKDELSIIL